MKTVRKYPVCQLLRQLISFVEAKAIYKKQMKKGTLQFHIDAYVHFFIDDQKFDSDYSGIWTSPQKALEVLSHFEGIISPDFSTYSDFPDPLKRWNTYRMRAFGLWLSENNISVINNVRWGEIETWDYCFDGLPNNSILAIGTVASGLKKLENRASFDNGLYELVKRTNPHTLIIYGSSNYQIFKELENRGIKIISFQSDTSKAFERSISYE